MVNWFEASALLLSAIIVPIFSKLGDMHGHKRMLLISTALTAGATWWLAVTGDFWSFLAAWSLQSFYVVWLPLEVALIFDRGRRTDTAASQTRRSAGFLVVALEAGALPRAMTGLMADDTLRAEVRSNGADWVMQRFGIDRVAGQLVEIYEAMLRDGPLPDLPVADQEWVDEIAALGIGEKPGPAGKLAFRLLQQPRVYRGYLGLRQLTGRLS